MAIALDWEARFDEQACHSPPDGRGIWILVAECLEDNDALTHTFNAVLKSHGVSRREHQTRNDCLQDLAARLANEIRRCPNLNLHHRVPGASAAAWFHGVIDHLCEELQRDKCVRLRGFDIWRRVQVPQCSDHRLVQFLLNSFGWLGRFGQPGDPVAEGQSVLSFQRTEAPARDGWLTITAPPVAPQCRLVQPPVCEDEPWFFDAIPEGRLRLATRQAEACCVDGVRLRHFTPTIWRRLEVVDRMPIWEVFQAIAVVLAYRISTSFESVPLVEADAMGRPLGGWPRILDGDVPLGACLPSNGSELRMDVELGAWRVAASFTKRRQAVPNATYPRCTGGQGYCIPEEPMRPKGFRRFLRALADDKHPRHGAALRRAQRYGMVGFALAAVNDDLRRFCRPVRAHEFSAFSDAMV